MQHPRAVDRPAVIELRRYTLHPGRRDELIDLFDRHLVESQEDCGMVVLGQFRDLDDPDGFVWLRGFPDMVTRRSALTCFYDGPVWAAHRQRANATMVDFSDVRLLRPVAGGGLAVDRGRRRPAGTRPPQRLVVATVWSFPPGEREGVELVRDGLVPALRETGPHPLEVLETEPAGNTFPRLPVRTGEHVVVVLTAYPDEAAHRRHVTAAWGRPAARDDVLPRLARRQVAPPRILRLAPTGRSFVR